MKHLNCSRFVKIGCALAMTAGLVGCSSNPTTTSTSEGQELTTVKLMLDYAPNTNHTGLYVAQNKGYFEEQGLKVEIIEPGDNATTSMVAAGKADFGVSYQEDVTYALTSEDPLPIKAIGTIIQHNTSGFVSLKAAGINSVKDFEGKTYAGWGAPSEEAVINAVMQKDGADFNKLTLVGSDGSGIPGLSEIAGANKVNLLWEFYGWAVTNATMNGYELNFMPLNELDERLDYYTPLLITNNDKIEKDPETVKKFMAATKKGYEFAIENPKESAKILHDVALPDTDLAFLEASQEYLSAEYAKDAPSWGVMKDSVWNNYTQFMFEYGLINQEIEASKMYTNEFVE